MEAGFRVPIRLLHENRPSDKQLDELWSVLIANSGRPGRFEFDSDRYEVLTESQFESQVAGPALSLGDKQAQENRFLALLAVGKVNHKKALAYLTAAQATERCCEAQWASALLLSDPAAYFWRNQVFRFVSVLAHYIPGVEVDCLPLPHPLSPKLDYLPAGLPGEACYALSALTNFGVDPAYGRQLWKIGARLATRDPKICENAARYAGWTRFLENAAQVHVRVLGACLAEDPGQLAGLQSSQRARFCFRSFRQFWGISDLAPHDAVERLILEFHAGRRAEGVPAFDSFYTFTEKIQARIREVLNRN